MKRLRHIVWDTAFGGWREILVNFGGFTFYIGIMFIPAVLHLISQVEDARKVGDPSLVELIQTTGTAEVYSILNSIITMLLVFIAGAGMKSDLASGTLTLVITRVSRSTYYFGSWLGVLLIASIYLAVGLAGYICLSLYFTSEISINIFALTVNQALKVLVLVSGAFIFSLLISIPRCWLVGIGLAVCFVALSYIPHLDWIPSAILAFLMPALLGNTPATLIYSSSEFPWGALAVVAAENILYAITLVLIGLAVFERMDIPSRRTG